MYIYGQTMDLTVSIAEDHYTMYMYIYTHVFQTHRLIRPVRTRLGRHVGLSRLKVADVPLRIALFPL